MAEHTNIPYIAYEGAMARFERINRRLWITIMMLAGLLVVSNLAWILYEAQYESYTITQEAENESGDIVLNGTGEVTIDGQGQADN